MSEIHDIIRNGETENISTIIRLTPGVINEPDVHGFTPLHLAAMLGREQEAKVLIDYGADINNITEHGVTPLHFAAEHGQSLVVAILLEAGAR